MSADFINGSKYAPPTDADREAMRHARAFIRAAEKCTDPIRTARLRLSAEMLLSPSPTIAEAPEVGRFSFKTEDDNAKHTGE